MLVSGTDGVKSTLPRTSGGRLEADVDGQASGRACLDDMKSIRAGVCKVGRVDLYKDDIGGSGNVMVGNPHVDGQASGRVNTCPSVDGVPGSGEGGMSDCDSTHPTRDNNLRRRSANFEKLLSTFQDQPATVEVQVDSLDKPRMKVKEVMATKVKVWERKDDEVIRKIVAKNVSRKWDVIKMCKNVMDDLDEFVEVLSTKEKLKEKVWWKEADRKKFTEWKTRNMRFLNLKESKKEPAATLGPLEQFCKMKGLAREKFDLEEKIEKENKELELELKEITQERKVSKSKRKKLEIYRKCRKRLENLTENWNETTKDREEQRKSKVLKEEAMKERLVKEIKETKPKLRKPDDRVKENLEIKSLEVTKNVICAKSDANQFVAVSTADLGCDNKPTVPYSARFGCKQKKNLLTKPQLLQESRRPEAELPAVDRAVRPMRDEPQSGTGPCGQWDEPTEIEQRKGRQSQ